MVDQVKPARLRAGLPPLRELGLDLLETNGWQRWQPFAMPYLYAAAFMLGWHQGWWILCAVALVMVFSACATSTHDVVHGTLGLTRRTNEWALFLLGAPVLESGHAYRFTHLEHHRIFPDHDDIEGEAAHQPIWKVLVTGPMFLPRLWWWSWQRSQKRPQQRRWLLVEGLLPILFLIAGGLLLPWTASVLAYGVTVILSSWLYPLFAVHLPHRRFEEKPIGMAWTCRGWLIPKLFLPLAFHLEHHLYPQVPSHNLPKLAWRLRKEWGQRGVVPIQVP